VLLGTLGPGGNSTTLSFAVDNGSSQTLQFNVFNDEAPQYHSQLFTANLTDGNHTVVASVPLIGGSTEGTTSNLFLDYFVFTPSVGATSGQGAMSFYDDSDPAFQYTGSWSTNVGTSEDMQGTLHGALALNSSASLQFTGIFLYLHADTTRVSRQF
jgi:hypothetical protein